MYLIFKRFFDIIGSLILLPFVFLEIIVLAPFIWLTDKGPVFYNALRAGKNYKPYKMYKLRSMYVNSPNLKNPDGSTYNSDDDPRVTPIGRIMRKTSLDELPELINIWKGDMAIVGPRPLLTRYLPFYTETERKRHTVRPGLTGLAQISGRNALAWDSRLALDVKYAEHITFLGDVKIILMTVIKVIRHEDVVDAGSFEMLDLDQERKSSVANNKSNL